MTWLYMRIYSNKASGEEVRFKIYDKSKSKISSANEKITFESEELVGMPSSPKKLSLVKFTLGDVNDDGKINAADIVAVKQIMAETASGNIIVDAADVNSDTKVNSADIVAIKKKMAE